MQTFNNEQDFINYLAPIAQRVCKRYGYKPSTLIAQVFQEVGAGVPRNFDNNGIYDLLKYHNLVGQKSDLLSNTWKNYTVWPGRSFRKTTPEEEDGRKIQIKDDFRIFDSDEQSLCDYILFLLYAKDSVYAKDYRYGPDVVNTSDPFKLIEKVGKKYATDSSYAKSISNIIRRYNLTQYDDLTGVEPTNIIPKGLQESMTPTTDQNVDKIHIIDITRENTPVRWGDTMEALVFHFLGVAHADNPYLYDGGYGGQWYIARNGDIYHAVKEGGVVCAVGSGGWGLKTDKWNNGNTESVEMGCENDNGSDDIYDKKWWFHMVTQEKAVKLARYWLEKHGYGVSEASVNKRILIHNSITNKPCPACWLHCAGYKSPKEKGHVNWNFEQFKKKIWQGYSGKTIADTDPTPTPTPTPTVDYITIGATGEKVKELQTMLTVCGYACGGVDGVFGQKTSAALKAFKKANGMLENDHYGAKTEEKLKKVHAEAQKNFATRFLSILDRVINITAKEEHWVYDDSHALPPCADHKCSCDRSPSRALYEMGYTDQREGGETCGTLPDWLPAHGWTKITDRKKIKPGAIVAVRKKSHNYIDHVFVVKKYYPDTDRCDKYDTGSTERIQAKQPYMNVLLVEWSDRVFVCAWNPPSSGGDTPSTSDRVWNGVDYKSVYAYNYYKKKYADLRKAYGNDKVAYFDHFCQHGMKEGRQGRSSFNVQKYKDRYADLRKKYGNDLPKYYEHYCVYGKKEGRKGN